MKRKFLNAASIGDIEAVRLALAENIDPNSKDDRGDTALIYAVANGHAEIVELLLHVGAKIEQENFFGTNALQNSAHFPEIYEMLLNHLLVKACKTGKLFSAKILAERACSTNENAIKNFHHFAN